MLFVMHKKAFTIYNASAGSGKTFTLVKEYLKIILLSPKNDAYRNILAITFTNKAVHEMKTRVVESLYEFAKDFPDEKAQVLRNKIAEETKLSPVDIQSKSKDIIKSIIHNYAAFDISTIDKFTHRVIRSFAHDLGLPITFEVSLETEALLTETIDRIIAEAGKDAELTNLLVDYTMEKTDDDKSWDISKEIFDVGRLILNENNREELTHFENKTLSEFSKIKENLKTVCTNIEEDTQVRANQILHFLEEKSVILSSFSGSYFPKHIQSIAQNKFNPNNKTYKNIEDIKVNAKAPDKDLIESLKPELLQQLDYIYKLFEKKHFYEAFQKNINPLSLLQIISKNYSEIQKEQNLLSIAEFNKLIHKEIQHQPAPFIYERMGERYRHFFIDEFQDTSIMQWENLIPLIDNALSGEIDGEKGSLMLVGDPKQSIYRWRGGKAEQFIELSKNNNPFSNPEKVVDSLKQNFRSHENIIQFNNQFFEFIAEEFTNTDYKNLYKNDSNQEINTKKGGYVSIKFIPEKKEIDEEVETHDVFLAETLQTIYRVKQNGFQNHEIVILTRKNEQGVLLANFLTENGIPVISSESLLIAASSDVQAIVQILYYLDNVQNLEAKAQLLYFLSQKNKEKIPTHSFISQGMALEKEHDFENYLLKFGYSFSFEKLRRKSLLETVQLIINSIINPTDYNAYIQYFLDTVLEFQNKKQSGLSDFLYYWEQKSSKLSLPLPEGIDAIKIMTIHKSKGLEFPVVIFPFANENYALKPQDKIWLDANEQELGLSKILVAKNKGILNFDSKSAEKYLEKSQEELLDNINILYVALTRAEEQLHIISQLVTQNKEGNYPNNMASFFIKFIEEKKYSLANNVFEYGNAERVSKTVTLKKEVQVIPQLDKILSPENIKIAQRESLMWNTPQQDAIAFGNTLHEILSKINTKKDIQHAIEYAIETGLINQTQREIIYQKIIDIVTNTQLQCFFEAENKVYNERTLIEQSKPVSKPDKMVVTKNNDVLLLDYKTGQKLDKHKQQMFHYVNTIESMNLKVVKKLLVYIGDSVEIVAL
ncbi:UvrD-helicase domain-containing protein [Flavobacterium croceum]|nr:UvrD-helicase domain-containing protein [Flavobacterium croceum]